MDCRKANELLINAAGNEIPEGLGQHLNICPKCRAEFEAIGSLYASLKADALSSPPDEFWEGMRAGIRDDLKKEGYHSGGLTGHGRRPGLMGLMVKPGWAGKLAPVALVIVMVVAISVFGLFDKGSRDYQLPVLVEVMESGLEPGITLNDEDAVIASIILDADMPYWDYYEMLSLEDAELEALYDSLGQVMKTL